MIGGITVVLRLEPVVKEGFDRRFKDRAGGKPAVKWGYHRWFTATVHADFLYLNFFFLIFFLNLEHTMDNQNFFSVQSDVKCGL